MIQVFISGILATVIHGIEVVLSPIETLLFQNAPELSTALGKFSDLIDYILSFFGYVIDLSGLSPFALSLIVSYMAFALTIPVAVWVVKVVVKWWHALVP